MLSDCLYHNTTRKSVLLRAFSCNVIGNLAMICTSVRVIARIQELSSENALVTGFSFRGATLHTPKIPLWDTIAALINRAKLSVKLTIWLHSSRKRELLVITAGAAKKVICFDVSRDPLNVSLNCKAMKVPEICPLFCDIPVSVMREV